MKCYVRTKNNEMLEMAGGQWVRYDDAQEALKEKDAEIARLQNELRDAESKYFELGCQYKERGERMEEMRMALQFYSHPIVLHFDDWFDAEGKAV